MGEQEHKKARKQAIMEITRLMDTKCGPCGLRACKTCPVQQQITDLGKIVTKETKDRRVAKAKKDLPPETNRKELTKGSYIKMANQMGLCDEDICKMYGIGHSTLRRYKKEWGVNSNYLLALRVEECMGQYADLKKQKISDTEICMKFGMSSVTLIRAKKAMGWSK